MYLSREQRKRMEEELDARLANNKIIYPSDIERSLSPRQFGQSGKCRNHKRNNHKR